MGAGVPETQLADESVFEGAQGGEQWRDPDGEKTGSGAATRTPSATESSTSEVT